MSDTLYHEFGNRWERPAAVAPTDFVPMLVMIAGMPVQSFVPLSMLPGGSGGTTGVFDVVTANTVAANTIAGNLNGTGSGTFSGSFTGTLVSNQLAASRTLFVDSSGSDSTGARGSSGYPFLTPGAAKAAAQAGDVIVVRPGGYAVTASLAKDGVNWQLDPGVTLTAASDGVTNRSVVDDGGTAKTLRVSGRGALVCTGTAADGGPGPACVRVTNAGSDVRAEAALLNYAAGQSGGDDSTGAAVYQSAGLLWVAADEIAAPGGGFGPGVWWANGDCRVHARKISASYSAVYVTVTGTPTGDFYVEADSVASSQYEAILVQASAQPEAKVWVRAKLIDTIAPALRMDGGKVYVEAQKIAGMTGAYDGTLGVLLVNGGKLWLDALKITATYESAINVTAGTARVTCQEIEDLGHLTQAVKVTGGTLWLFNAVINTVGDGVVCSGGTVHLVNCTITTAGAKKDLVQSGSGSIIVHPGTTGSGAAGVFTKTGSPTFLTGGP